MKMGLITIHDTMNFGSLLQTFGLYKAIEDLGYDVTLVDYKWNSRDSRESTYPLRKCRTVKQVIRSLMIHKVLQKKYDNFWCFIRNNMKVSAEYNRGSITNANDLFDAFVIGSDLVWSLEITGSDYSYFLDFAGDEKKKIAFSSSVGTLWPEEKRESIGNLLKRFDHIAVREELAASWIEEIIGFKPDVSCDPTMLMESDMWLNLAKEQNKIDQPYVLVYFDALNKQNLYDGISYGKLHDMPVYYINYGKPIVGAKSIKPMSIEEWIALIRDADTVFSASYHGLLFSLYFEKNVYYYNRANKSRMSSLAKELGIENHEGTASNILADTKIDYQHINELINRKRNESHLLLKEYLDEIAKGTN